MANFAIGFIVALAFSTLALLWFVRCVVPRVQQAANTPPSPPTVNPCLMSHDFRLISSQSCRTDDGRVATLILKRCYGCSIHISIPIAGDWPLAVLMLQESEVSSLERAYGG